MTDWLSREQRSRNMASIRSAGNKTTELVMVGLLRSARISGWRRHLPLPGRPDFAFPQEKLAIFIDGCFWHACPRCYRLPEDNRAYWKNKMLGNRARDKKNSRDLRAKGWKVLRVWEHSLKSHSRHKQVTSKIVQALGKS